MWPFVYSISISLYLIGNYPEWRDGIFTLTHDVSALWLWLSSRGHFGSSSSATPAATDTRLEKTRVITIDHNSTAIWMPPGSSEMRLRTRALLALGTVATQPYRTYQGIQIHHNLRDMARLLPISPPDPYTAMLSSAPSSFACTVRDFVALKCSEYSSRDADAYSHHHHHHRVFVLHPDTAWMGAFARLQDTHGPPPLEFAGVAHNLFVLARWMLCERVALVQALGDEAGCRVRFHVLVPSAETLVVPLRVCFVNALAPLTVEGPTSKGRPLVWLNIDCGPTTVLRDVGAIPPPCPDMADGKASIASGLLCSVQMPLYVALAVSLLFHGFALNATLWLKREVREYYMQQDAPTTLG